jgi:hypothetical protein
MAARVTLDASIFPRVFGLFLGFSRKNEPHPGPLAQGPGRRYPLGPSPTRTQSAAKMDAEAVLNWVLICAE